MTPPAAPAALTPAPALADGLELLGGLQGSGYRSAPGLVRRADGQTVQVTTVLYALLELVDGRRDDAVLAQLLGARLGREVAAEDVRFLLEQRAEPLSLLRGDAPAAPVADPLLALSWKVVIADPVWTWRLTTPFAALFRPYVVVPVLVAFAWTTWWLLVERGLAGAARAAVYEPGMLLAVVAITVASAGFHELGHAAACRYGGARPGAMGVGVYLVWPAFFTDVDDSYRLSRWGRLRVDLGGLYFNAVVAVALVAAWGVWGAEALLLGIAAQLLQMVRQLAPFLRADGYHLLADLTGVPDLFAHLGPTLRALVPGRPRTPTPLKRWARVVVTTWVLVVVPVLLALLVGAVLVLPRLVVTAWDSAGLRLDALGAAAATGDPVRAGAELVSLIALVLPVLGITYCLLRVVRRTARRTWALTADRPRARALAVLAGLLLAGLVAWSWLPDAQRTPLSAGDRGSLADLLAPAGELLVPLAAVAPEQTAAPAATTPAAATPAGTSATTAAYAAPAGPARLQAVRPTAAPGTGPSIAFGPPTDRVLRLKVPLPPLPGGNQALAVGTRDGKLVYDLAYAVVEVRDRADVTNVNEAWALASCADCTTVAVAVQVVLVIGGSPVVVPVNAAVAANDQCLRCTTTAIAVQLVVTLTEEPSAAVRGRIGAELARLNGLRARVADMTPAQLLAEVKAVEAAVLAVLLSAGLVDTGTAPSTATATGGPVSPVLGPPSGAAPTTTGPTAIAAPTAAPTAGPSAPPSPQPSPAPTVGPASAPEPDPLDPAPSPSPAPTEPDPAAPSSGPATGTVRLEDEPA